ncbi:HDIG domain-containing protein [Clostridium sp. AL.422]|uniref:HD family phosphohydrolase n=1 Tax=Clostridium TaxID=1485 RepID=UPI00293DAD61|nr:MULTISPECIES: HDIG domain-containing metalloprotein [unclassified Clostridium]MDV4150110.1 HDIG domain-containing protein [Clostridium sp. AL.422]
MLLKKDKKKDEKKDTRGYKRVLIYATVFLITYVILLTTISPKKHNLEVGDIATVDIKAPIDTVDEIATQEKIEEAIAKAKGDMQYTVKSEVKTQAVDNITKLFNKVATEVASNKDSKEKLTEIKKVDEFRLTDEEYNILLSIETSKVSDIQSKTLEALDMAYKNNIEENDYEALQKAKDLASQALISYNLERSLEDTLKSIVYSQIKANLFIDTEKMEENIKEAQKNVQKEIIKKNQIIVKEGEPITERQIELLNELGLLNTGITRSYVLSLISLAVLIALVLFLEYTYLYRERMDIFKSNKLIILISSINIISLMLSLGLNIISPYLIPSICGAILMTVLIDYRVSLVINLMNLVFVSIVVSFDPAVIVLSMIGVVLGSIAVKKVQQRNDIIYSTIYITAVLAILVMSVGMILSNNLMENLIQVLYTSVGVIISGILSVGLLPFYESIFDVVTNIKLLELSNPNQPLMKKLLMEAPGTYHHSMMVANLAEAATEAVGGNPVLARVGAYYHDIGKTKRPYFFGENQLGKENPHDRITPNLSTLIILSHTKDGIEMAKEHNIPKIIQDIIVQHHGTTLVKYFYYKVKNSAENPDDVKEEDFRYSGPIPDTKESGILMLADSVEASVRSIPEPTKDKIENMVNNIINDKISTNQLINCDLTLKDIEIIRKSFLKTLDGIYHHRVEYPTEKK